MKMHCTPDILFDHIVKDRNICSASCTFGLTRKVGWVGASFRSLLETADILVFLKVHCISANLIFIVTAEIPLIQAHVPKFIVITHDNFPLKLQQFPRVTLKRFVWKRTSVRRKPTSLVNSSYRSGRFH